MIYRLIINAISLWVAAYTIPGVHFDRHANILTIFTVALIFGGINAVIRPILDLVTCPIYMITLGLFTFIMNALMLALTSWLSGYAFMVDGFVSAFLGSIVISMVSTVLSVILKPRKHKKE